ncbi:ABC transporter ATP-binding protein [Magnetospira sp. QH-2]|uniref:ABC transporter ATP-binding protein n=1 Tax=Magnetospira sp. (strain QH-2) TaxID=1288970 RepID=UPI0003E81471|nr:ABC transporter ATP-binding protein [Magnetospira sp. QH-2]CCQ73934.1 ABC transporter, ATPase component. substrate unknown [Magnetospira sp. QH-2]
MTEIQTPSPLSIHVRAGSLSFGGKVLFENLDMDLAAGQWTCLLGASGVGKSSLLRLIAGLETQTAGETRVETGDGVSLDGRIAYMAQSDLLLPWLSVLDNLALGERLRQGSIARPVRDRAEHLLDRVGLTGHGNDLPKTLSGGMRQRVALARTLMEDRPLVLMDEPFASLDVLTRLKLQDLAAELLEGRTVLLVTHDPLEALRLGHEVRVLSGRPARFLPPLHPEGSAPRHPDDPAILAKQGELLARLAEGQP